MDLIVDRIQRTILQSQASAHDDPAKMRTLARKAVRMAGELPPGSTAANDLRAEAWANFGNALRVCNDLPAAGPAFEWAWHFHALGVGGTHLTARIHELQASLFEAVRRFPEALASLDLALEMREATQDLPAIGRCLVKRANVVGHSGDPEGAILLLRRAMGFVRAAETPGLAYALVHNLCWFLVDAGHADTAMTLLLEAGHLPAPDDALVRLRARWLEGRILAAVGDYEQARCEMANVSKALAALDLPYEVALVSLERALICPLEEALSAMYGLREVFKSLGVERETAAAQLLEEILGGQVELASAVPCILHALRVCPGLRERRPLQATRRPMAKAAS
jgi:tetratricopeptide (TPR) repeat protein